MKREISSRLLDGNIVQTTTTHNDDGSLREESVSRLGEREAVLGHLEEQVAEATRDRDGMMSVKAGKPAPPGNGSPGLEVAFFVEGKTLFRVETNRDKDGKLVNQRTTPLGDVVGRQANAEERLAELTAYLDAAKAAQ